MTTTYNILLDIRSQVEQKHQEATLLKSIPGASLAPIYTQQLAYDEVMKIIDLKLEELRYN